MDEKKIKILGVVFILLWASHIPYLFPRYDLVKGLSEESENTYKLIFKVPGPVVRTPAAEIERQLIRGLRIAYLKSFFIIAGGILAGILIILKKNAGRIMALALSFLVVGMRLFYLVTSDYWRERLSFEYYKIQFEYFPFRSIHDKITFIVLLATIILLLMPSTTALFINREEPSKSTGSAI